MGTSRSNLAAQDIFHATVFFFIHAKVLTISSKINLLFQEHGQERGSKFHLLFESIYILLMSLFWGKE